MEEAEDMFVINYKVPHVVQHNLRELVTKNPNGLWGSNLLQAYRKLFKKELEYLNYGYASIEHMCYNLNYMFTIKKHVKGDFKIFDIRMNIPQSIITEEDLQLRPSVLQYKATIKRAVLPAVNTHIQIKISEIYDPSKFWFYVANNEDKLNDIMDRMQLFYKSTGRYYKIPSYQMKKGLYCAAVYYDEFHRGVIVNTLPQLIHSVKIFFIDYGTTEIVSVQNVYFLHESFKEPHAFAIRGQLSNIKPIGFNMPWSQASAMEFKNMVKLKTNTAAIKSTYLEGKEFVYCLTLFDKSSKTGHTLNEQLILMEHGLGDNDNQDESQSIPEFINNTQMMHLVPTFTELESGSVPNRYEMNILLAQNCPLHQILTKYLKPMHK